MWYPLLSERLSIEPLSNQDTKAFVDYRKDPQIARFQSWDQNYSEAQAMELIQSQAGVLIPLKGEWLQLAIHHRGTAELIGDLALHTLEEDESYEIGFTLSKRHQGKGFAKEAASCLLNFLFDQLGAKRIIASTDSRNYRSMKLLEALGFSQNLDKSWQEEFKNETVTVLFFENTR